MEKIPQIIIKTIGKKLGRRGEGGASTGNDTTAPGIGTINGTNDDEPIADRYAEYARQIGWEGFDYAAFTAAVQRATSDGKSEQDAAKEVFENLRNGNPDLNRQMEEQPDIRPPHEPPGKPSGQDYFPPQEGKAEPPGPGQQTAEKAKDSPDTSQDELQPKEQGNSEAKPPQPEPQGEAKVAELPTDPRTASMLAMAKAPIADTGLAPLVKDTATWTEAEMRRVLDKAQAGFTGWRSGDPLKAHSYERVQDWHVGIYGDDPQGNDGGKPIEPKPIRPIPITESPARTPDGEDLFAASGRIAGTVADAAGSLGHADAVKALQGGLNLLGTARQLPARSPAYGPYTKQAPLAEDGEYGPRTDFALKQSLGRHGAAKVDEAFALGRFNQFARAAQRRRDPAGLESAVHGALGPLFRAGAGIGQGEEGPKVEGGILQETLNQMGGDRFDDWQPLKVDDWVGPKTTEGFGRVLDAADADAITRRYGRNLGLF